MIIVCKKCGRILMKTDEPIVAVLKIEIQCPKCEEILKLPNDGRVIKVDETKDIS